MGNSRSQDSSESLCSETTGKALFKQHRTELLPSETSLVPLISHSVYAQLAEHVYNNSRRKSLPTGWRKFASCDEFFLNRDGYCATAFINDGLKHCIIAERGTSDYKGARAVVWMYFCESTAQFSLAEQFSKLVRFRLSMLKSTLDEGRVVKKNEDEKTKWLPDSSGDAIDFDYVISYTGHSLGAVLATVRAAAEQTYAITFESPGCRPFIQKCMYPLVNPDDVDVITYQCMPNLINTLQPQIGYVLQLPLINLPSDYLSRTPGDSQQPQQKDTKEGGAVSGNSATEGNANEKKNASSSTFGESGGKKIKIESSIAKPNWWSVIPKPGGYLKNKMFTYGMPNEVSTFFLSLEPVFKDMLSKTAQSHIMSNIADYFSERDDECLEEKVAVAWPSNPLQFLEYFNAVKEIAEVEDNAHGEHAVKAYDAIMYKLYSVATRPKYQISLNFLNRDSRKLLYLWWKLTPTQLKCFGLSEIEIKALNTTTILVSTMRSNVLTAFQMKMLLSTIVMRERVRNCLDKFPDPSRGAVARASKM